MEGNLYNTEEEIDLKKIVYIIANKWKIIIAVTILSAILAFIISQIYSLYKAPIPIYQASANINIVALEDKPMQKQAFIEMVRSQTVMENAIAKLKLTETPKELLEDLSVTNQEGSNVISLSVLNPDADLATKIVGTIRQEAILFAESAIDLDSIDINGNAVLLSDPILEKSPVNIKLNTIIGGILGLMVIIFIIFLQIMLNDKIQTSEDVEKYLGLRVLAIIPFTVEEKANANLKQGGTK
ncbi:MAG: YveK family protein [Eubacteriales bacterium]